MLIFSGKCPRAFTWSIVFLNMVLKKQQQQQMCTTFRVLWHVVFQLVLCWQQGLFEENKSFVRQTGYIKTFALSNWIYVCSAKHRIEHCFGLATWIRVRLGIISLISPFIEHISNTQGDSICRLGVRRVCLQTLVPPIPGLYFLHQNKNIVHDYAQGLKGRRSSHLACAYPSVCVLLHYSAEYASPYTTLNISFPKQLIWFHVPCYRSGAFHRHNSIYSRRIFPKR